MSGEAARAATYAPPRGKLFAGVSAGVPSRYDRQTGVHSAVFEEFIGWGGTFDWALQLADRNRSRAVLHISTLKRFGGEVISPGGIASGRGDKYLLRLASVLGRRGRPTYIRIMAEMNGWWQPYCAFKHDGRPRGRSHSTWAFRQAWRRIVIILRGGPLQAVDRHLRTLGMPDVRAPGTMLPSAPVAFIFTPQTAGNPDIPANGPWAYYPGRAYVDWIGTDFYSRFAGWRGLNSYYQTYLRGFADKPFMFGEWGMWGRDDPAFASEFFSWVHAHKRVRMLLYFQNYDPRGPFNLGHFPRARAIISRELKSSLFAPLTSEWAPRREKRSSD